MKYLLMLPLAFLASPLSAQSTSGTIAYRQTISLDIKDADIPEGMAAFIPKEHSVEKVMYYNADATLYENKEEGSGDEHNEIKQDNMTIRIERKAPDEKVFLDLKNKKCIEQKDLMGRSFLITKDIGSRKWKFTGRQKKLLDQPCMEAVWADGTDSVTAWYTTAIPVVAGPQSFAGLPGMILEVWDGANVHIVATSIAAADDKLLGKKLKAPTKGKKISEEEYAALAKKKAEEMQEQFGGKGVIIHQVVR